MNRFFRSAVLAASLLACAAANAVIPVRGVELPPPPTVQTTPDPKYWAPGTLFPSYVIQTSAGNIECPRRWYEAAVCRDYIPGRDKRPRAFVRKVGGQWIVCSRPNGNEGCVGIRDLPIMVKQD